MASKVEKKLNIFIYPTSSFQVSIPGKHITSCDGKCHKVELDIKYYKLKSPMYVMEIGGVDIVLGAQWLETVGKVGLNIQEQFIRLYENGKKYKLHGIKCPAPKIISSNKMEKMIKKGAQSFFLHCYSMDEMDDESKKRNLRELEKLVEKHSNIFQIPPSGLPPPHSRDHIIEMIPSSTPIRKKIIENITETSQRLNNWCKNY